MQREMSQQHIRINDRYDIAVWHTQDFKEPYYQLLQLEEGSSRADAEPQFIARASFTEANEFFEYLNNLFNRYDRDKL